MKLMQFSKLQSKSGGIILLFVECIPSLNSIRMYLSSTFSEIMLMFGFYFFYSEYVVDIGGCM